MSTPKAIAVPRNALIPEAPRGMIEEFVTRPGTDYGAQERTIEENIVDVQRQLERSEAMIVFDATTATPNIVPACGRSVLNRESISEPICRRRIDSSCGTTSHRVRHEL